MRTILKRHLENLVIGLMFVALVVGVIGAVPSIIIVVVIIGVIWLVGWCVLGAWAAFRRWQRHVDRQIDDGPLRDDPPMFIG